MKKNLIWIIPIVVALFILLVYLIGRNWTFHNPPVTYTAKTDSLLQVLDRVILEKPEIIKKKYQVIDSLKSEVVKVVDEEELKNIQKSLFQEYISFRMDSALYYAEELQRLCANDTNPDTKAELTMNIADAKIGLGLYSEAEILLDSLQVGDKTENIYRYNSLYFNIYHQLHLSAFETSERLELLDSIIACQQRMLSCIPQNTLDYDHKICTILYLEKKPWEALRKMQYALNKYQVDIDNAPYFTNQLGKINLVINQEEEAINNFAYSAIADLRSNKKLYTSLQKLALILFNRGDQERAYRYINCDMEDVNFSQAKCGLIEIAEYIPILISTYNNKASNDQTIQQIYLIFIALFIIALIVLIIMLQQRGRHLGEANEKLEKNNDEMKNFVQQLNEANQLKEAYIGQVFNLCSIYMDKQEKFRKSVSNMLVSGQTKELTQMLQNKTQEQEGLQVFIHSFDNIFISLFPDFIEKFQQLLKDGEQLEIKEDELLTPEMRIYALVRLGINDSTQIAKFLHLSAQTIYNYRFRMRSRVRMPKEDFLEAVRNL